MLLINNLFGDYDSETSAGRGANAASNLIKYIRQGKKIEEQKAQKFKEGKLSVSDLLRNSAFEKLTTAYIPYTEINEETGRMDFDYALAFATVYINAFDKDKDGAITIQEAGPCGVIIDQINPTGKITRGKFLAWLIFQDCISAYNGVISPQEAGKALYWASKDPEFVIQKLKEIYNKLNLKEKEENFQTPQPINS